MCIRAVAEIPTVYNPEKIDLEEFHDKAECLKQATQTVSTCLPKNVIPLSRLTVSGDTQGNVSQALAGDELANMRLDAWRVVEARQKEMEYVKEKQVWRKITRK